MTPTNSRLLLLCLLLVLLLLLLLLVLVLLVLQQVGSTAAGRAAAAAARGSQVDTVHRIGLRLDRVRGGLDAASAAQAAHPAAAACTSIQSGRGRSLGSAGDDARAGALLALAVVAVGWALLVHIAMHLRETMKQAGVSGSHQVSGTKLYALQIMYDLETEDSSPLLCFSLAQLTFMCFRSEEGCV